MADSFLNMNTFSLDQINPLAGLDEWQLVALLNAGQRGDLTRLQWLYFFVEKRNPYARAVKRRLLSAIGKLDWDIKEVRTEGAKDAEKNPLAKEQAAVLRKAYDAIGNLQNALNFLALAELRGYSHLEKIYDADLNVIELRIVEQWFWMKDGWYGAWSYNAEAREGLRTGTAIKPENFIIRTVDDAVNEIMARCHVRMETADGDWEEYLRDYGLPNIIIEGPPNVPAEKEAQYQAQAERITGGARGYIPNGAKVHSVESNGGDDAFKKRMDHLAELIAIGGTGGKLNILTESGTGTMGAGASKDAFDEMAESIAGEISAILQDQFDKPILEREFPGQPVLAYFELASVDAEDKSKVLGDAKSAHDAGYEIDPADLSERTGYKITRILATENTENTEVKASEPVLPAIPPVSVPSVDSVAKPPAFPDAVARVLNVSQQIVSPAASVFDQLESLAADASLTCLLYTSDAADE